MGKNIRWIIVLLLFLVYMINYLDRVALSITVPMIEKDLALNAEQFGIIFGFVNGMVASHLLCHSGTINRHSLNGALLS